MVNLSLGNQVYDVNLAKAVKKALDNGVTVVASMGNKGTNLMSYPASYDGVIAVVATDRDNRRAFYSSFGPWATIAAPGTGIYSTYKDGSYVFMDGTSMAAPVVTGVVALYASVYGRQDPAQVAKRLKSTATKGGSNLGAGVVNAANMLSSKPGAPYYGLTAKVSDAYVSYDASGIPCETKLTLNCQQKDKNDYILYTLDGKTPSVKSGMVVNGTEYDPDDPNGYIDLEPYAGSTVTVKAVQVNGLGMVGSVMTLKLKVLESNQITKVEITGPQTLNAGKTGLFSATVYPTEKADQRVTWGLVEPVPGVTIGKKGELKATAAAVGKTVEVQATSVASPKIKSNIISVDIQPSPLTKTMALEDTTVKAHRGARLSLDAPTLKDAAGEELDPQVVGVKWSSSNTKVAKVQQMGSGAVVTALAKGSATITCKALDGSGKSAKLTLTVTQPVERITITGPESFAPGTTTQLKATVAPASASVKTVSWSLEGAPSGVSIDQKGKLKVESGTSSCSFTVVAKATDGTDIRGEMTARVLVKCKQLRLGCDPYPGKAQDPVYKKSGVLTTVNLFNVDLPGDDADDSAIRLRANTDVPGTGIRWSSSNTKVATVSEDGLVQALSAGTAKITAAATDGSGKKATVTVKVTVPASFLTISPGTYRRDVYYKNDGNMNRLTSLGYADGVSVLNMGKSSASKVVFGDTYGVPTNKKVKWSLEVFEVKRDGTKGRDYTSTLKAQKKVSLSSSGTLSTKASLKEDWWNLEGGVFLAVVTATATDGSDASYRHGYVLTPPTTGIVAESSFTVKSPEYTGLYYTTFRFAADQWAPNSLVANLAFDLVSSNPKVAGVDGWKYLYTSYGVKFFEVKVRLYGKGTTTVKITAADGSKKSASCKITVK